MSTFTSDGRLLTGIEAVEADVYTRLNTLTGEWFLNSGVGIPLLGLLGRTAGESLAADELAAAAGEVPDVLSVRVVRRELDPATRRLTVELEVDTVYGPTTARAAVDG